MMAGARAAVGPSRELGWTTPAREPAAGTNYRRGSDRPARQRSNFSPFAQCSVATGHRPRLAGHRGRLRVRRRSAPIWGARAHGVPSPTAIGSPAKCPRHRLGASLPKPRVSASLGHAAVEVSRQSLASSGLLGMIDIAGCGADDTNGWIGSLP